MYLTSLTHRDAICAIGQNWLGGHVDPGDGTFLTTAFLLEPAITAPSVTGLLAWAFAPRLPGDLRLRQLRTKEQVRRCIMRSWASPTPRVRRLFEDFERLPESFFPTTPVDMTVATAPDETLVAMVRFKNLFRIADKVARRAAHRLREETRSALLRGAGNAATDDLENAPGFAAALDQVSQAFLEQRLRFSRDDFRVDDAIGVKLIFPEEEFDGFERRLASHPDVLSLRHTEHHGAYNDVHLLAEVRCPPRSRTVARLLSMDWGAACVRRGLPAHELSDLVPQYVETGAGTFFLEILLTTLPELIESEFGRGLHELRTVRQRLDPLWNDRIPTNVLLTTLAMLLVALAPTVCVTEPPVKLSGRYLPETALGILAQLFGVDVARSPFWMPSAIPGL